MENISLDNRTPDEVLRIVDSYSQNKNNISTFSIRGKSFIASALITSLLLPTPGLASVKEIDSIVNKQSLCKSMAIYEHLLSRDSILSMIRSYGKLSENWDGYDAIPVDNHTLKNSEQIIGALSFGVIGIVYDYYPNSNGTLSFRWQNKTGNIYLEVGNTDFSYYVEKNGNVSCYDNVNMEDVSDFRDELNSFLDVKFA